MSIFFATPCYGGQMMVPFVQSMIQMTGVAREVGLPCNWDLISNESLIQRARNNMAAYFLWETDYERLMFIDSDIEFSPDDVSKLWNLDADIAVGIYAMKKPDEDVYAGWVDGKLVDIKELNGITPLDYAGTGFMQIKREVLRRMYEEWPERRHEEGQTKKAFAWFDPRVVDAGAGPFYASEDYAFCRDARSLGYEILCDPSIRLKHYGLYGYGGSNAEERLREAG